MSLERNKMIRDSAIRLRNAIAKDNAYFDIVYFLEFTLPKIQKKFSLEIRDDHIMSGCHAKAKPELNTIILSRTTYMKAREGSHVERHVLAHELGHLLFHKCDPVYSKNATDEKIDFEEEAEIFADELLAPQNMLCNVKSDGIIGLTKIFGVPEPVIHRQILLINS